MARQSQQYSPSPSITAESEDWDEEAFGADESLARAEPDTASESDPESAFESDANAVAEGATETAEVPEWLVGQRIDRTAADLFPEHSRARLQRWMEAGQLLRNGQRVARLRDPVALGDVLSLTPPPAPVTRVRPQPIALNIVYQDEHLVVIDKPAGLTVHPGAGCADGTLQNALLHHFPQTAAVPRAGIVHRLDKDTTGLMVAALTLQTHTHLVAALAARDVRREYEALVNGAVTVGGTVDAPIGRDHRHRLRMAVTRDGRPAVSHYRVLERFTHQTLLRVRLETGRTHQIRVHMAHLRYPLIGDALYGGQVVRGAGMDPELREALQRFPRQALHARELAFEHPVTGVPLQFESPLAADLQQLLVTLRARGQTPN